MRWEEESYILIHAQFVNRKMHLSRRLLSRKPRDENIFTCFKNTSHAAKLWREFTPMVHCTSKLVPAFQPNLEAGQVAEPMVEREVRHGGSVLPNNARFSAFGESIYMCCRQTTQLPYQYHEPAWRGPTARLVVQPPIRELSWKQQYGPQHLTLAILQLDYSHLHACLD